MARYPCEMFARFYYSPSLTYEELHQAEEELMQKVDIMLAGEGGIHLEFWPDSDSLAVQGEFDQFEKSLFDGLADKIKAVLPRLAQARMVLVDKYNLERIYIYNISSMSWEMAETVMARPFAEEGI